MRSGFDINFGMAVGKKKAVLIIDSKYWFLLRIISENPSFLTLMITKVAIPQKFILT